MPEIGNRAPVFYGLFLVGQDKLPFGKLAVRHGLQLVHRCGGKLAHIYTFNASLKRRLEDFSRKYPLLCRLERSTPEGSVTYVMDKSRLSIRLVPPYSEERLAAAREYAKEHGFQVIQTEEKIA